MLYRAIVFLFALVVCFWTAQAQKPQPIYGFEIVPDESEPFEAMGDIRISTETGQAISWYNLNAATIPGTTEEKARDFLRNNLEILRLDDENLQDLQLQKVRTSQAGTTVRFQQVYQSIPVYKATLAINISPKDQVVFLMNSYRPGIDNLNVEPVISASTARSIGYDYLSPAAPFSFESNRLVVYSNKGSHRLAYEVIVAPQSPTGEWEILVDAHTGQIFKVVDRALYYAHGDSGEESEETNNTPEEYPACDHAAALPPPAPVNGVGNVFNPDPLSSAGQTYAGQYVDNNDNNNASLTAELFNFTLRDIDLTAGTHSLRGPYAEIQDFENPNRGLFSQASSVFNYNRQQNAFEAVNCYYFIDMSMRYINDTLMCNIMPFQYTTGVRVDPHGLNGADNSHYLGGSGRVAFGEGGVDDAEDVDVVLHELGHGIHDWVTGGNLSQVNGLSEGSGDYWAASYSRSLNQWASTDPQYFWVFDWDGHNPFWNGRRTDYPNTYPGGLVGQIHTDGQIWSTCLMRIWNAIGRTQMDKAFLEGLGMTNGSTNQQDAAIAVRQAAINMNYPISEINTMTTILTSCGYILPPFPVQMEVFEAKRTSFAEVELGWETASESNNKGFHVERQLGDEDFEKVGFVPAAIVSDGNRTYQFTDQNDFRGRSRYRLRQEDMDGTMHYSEIREVYGSQNADFEVALRPNPATDVIYLRTNLPAEDLALVEVTDLTGKLLFILERSGGTNEIAVSLENLAPGYYIIKIKSGMNQQALPFIKR
jgi:Zn-dependent metalloprotease